MYQNLVKSWDDNAPESIHLCEYPDPDKKEYQVWKEPDLNLAMKAAQVVVRMGHKLREESNRRVRQPLGEIHVSSTMTVRQQAIADLFPESSLAAAWINFPDPWPKARHAHHRLVQPAFVRALARRLAPAAVVNLATDDPEYAAQMAEVLAGEPLLENLYAPETCRRESAGRSPTAYELEWQALGRRGYYFAYRRRPEHLGVGDPA